MPHSQAEQAEPRASAGHGPSPGSGPTLDELLQTTSRTFALAIPLLPEPERTDVTLGYLVFRIADTLEDADNLPRDARRDALADFAETLADLSPERLEQFTDRWASRRPCDNDDYQRLMENTPAVLGELAARPAPVRETVVDFATRSIRGMAETLERATADAELRCESIDQLRGYCYHVAGIVGELLTQLFELRLGDSSSVKTLRQQARWFGEGLQLVNILKDADADAAEGRSYLPAGVPLAQVFELADDDLLRAASYIDALREAEAPAGYIAFCRAPREMAVATLAKLRTDGPGAKITREQVAAIMEAVREDRPVADPSTQGN
ncbi:MAG: squalene/phytoene synthase family protein [Planctomycetota bacterium]